MAVRTGKKDLEPWDTQTIFILDQMTNTEWELLYGEIEEDEFWLGEKDLTRVIYRR